MFLLSMINPLRIIYPFKIVCSFGIIYFSGILLSLEFGCKGTAISANHRFKYFAVDGLFRNNRSFLSHKLCTFVPKKRIKWKYMS